jgi:hypothetical protein
MASKFTVDQGVNEEKSQSSRTSLEKALAREAHLSPVKVPENDDLVIVTSNNLVHSFILFFFYILLLLF